MLWCGGKDVGLPTQFLMAKILHQLIGVASSSFAESNRTGWLAGLNEAKPES